MTKKWFYNATLDNGKAGGLIIDHDHIIDYGEACHTCDTGWDGDIYDCKRYYLLPAIIDSRVTLGESVSRETLPINLKSATAASGITTLINIPSDNFYQDRPSQLSSLTNHQSQYSDLRLYAHAALTQELQGEKMAEIGLLKQSGALALSNGCYPIQRADVMLRIMTYAAMFDMIVIQHAEDSYLVKDAIVNQSEIASRMGLIGAPAIAEVMMIERDLHLLRHHYHLYHRHARYHVAHISTKAGVDAIAKAKDEGLYVTCDTAPPYFALNDHAIDNYRTHTKLSPPLRTEQDRQAIIDGIKNGIIDIIASDHIPRTADEKRLPYHSADYGSCGIETLYALTLELYHSGYISLKNMATLLSHNAARLFNLDNLGILNIGKKADFMLLDIQSPWVLDETKLINAAKNTPFHGRPLQGKIKLTYCNGQEIYNQLS